MNLKDRFFLKLGDLVARSVETRSYLQFEDHKLNKRVVVGAYTYGVPKIVWDKYSNFKISIGRFCSIAKNVTIHNGSNHNVQWVSTFPHRIMFDLDGKGKDGHPCSKGDVNIGNDVWIGENVTIFSGVKIGDGAVVAGNSVVVRDVDPYSVCGGVPAKMIKKRFENEEIKKLLLIKWWDWELEKIKKSVPLLCSDNVKDFINEFS